MGRRDIKPGNSPGASRGPVKRVSYRNARARQRAALAEQAANLPPRSKRCQRLVADAIALLSPWERALYKLHLHFDACRSIYGSWADDFLLEFERGCMTRWCFMGIVISIFDLDGSARWSEGMQRLVASARDGTLELRWDDRDIGALFGGARA
jgi:hypothetical protein